MSRDIDSAAKFIGAGAATVGVAGSGKIFQDKQIYPMLIFMNCFSPNNDIYSAP